MKLGSFGMKNIRIETNITGTESLRSLRIYYIFYDIVYVHTIITSQNNQNTNISVTSSDHPTMKPGLRNIQRNTHVKNNVATPYS